MSAEFLADPNEDQEAADFFTAKFRKEGVPAGGPLSLVVRITKIPIGKLSTVESEVRKLYDCSRVERKESGILSKRAQLTAYLNPIVFERSNLLKAARAMYHIILRHEVTVELESSEKPEGQTPQIWSKEGLRKGIAMLCMAYCMVAWFLPAVVVAIFGDLPYLQERPFLDRLPLSAGGTLALVGAMAIFFPDGFRIYRTSTVLKRAKHWLGATLGLAMFTGFAAASSGSLFGSIVKLTPGSDYSAGFTVVDVDVRGSSYRTVYLSLRPAEGTKVVYLTLSRRLFGYPQFRVGERVMLVGKQNLAGIYVDSITAATQRQARRVLRGNDDGAARYHARCATLRREECLES